MQAAIAAVKAAGSQVTAKPGRWDKIIAGYAKVSKDSDAFIGTVAKVLAQFRWKQRH